MEVPSLIGLREGMMVCDAIAVVAEATEVRLGALLLLNGDSHDFDLVVGEADFDLKLGRHLEFVSFNRIIVILLLLGHLVTFLHHLLLHLLLLELLKLLLRILALHLTIHELLLLAVLGHHGLSVHVDHVWVLLHHLLLHGGLFHHLLLMLSFCFIHTRLLLAIHIIAAVGARSGWGSLLGRGLFLLLRLLLFFGRGSLNGGCGFGGKNLCRFVLLFRLVAHIQTLLSLS